MLVCEFHHDIKYDNHFFLTLRLIFVLFYKLPEQLNIVQHVHRGRDHAPKIKITFKSPWTLWQVYMLSYIYQLFP